MVSVTASDGLLRVKLQGRDAVWSFKRTLNVPLSSVREIRVTHDLSPWLGVRHNELGLRLPGTQFPGLVALGSYWWKDRGWTFCCVRRRDRHALVVDLEPGPVRYRRLVLGVEDAQGTLAQIESARQIA
jgi:hypothetical protein